MKNIQKIGGFSVEALLMMHGEKVQWSVKLIDLPFVRAEGPSFSSARQALIEKWEMTVAAYRAAGEPVPKPRRPRGHKRTLDTIRRLGEKKFTPIF